jgi:hypothetical protein
MADLAMLASRQIRLAAIAALDPAAFPGVTVESPGDWNTPPESLPAILLRCADDNKESITKGQPEFTTTVAIEISVRVAANTAADAQDAIEALVYSIETALLTNYDLIKIINQVASVSRKMQISAEGRVHFGSASMRFDFEVPEMFEPTDFNVPPALTSFGLHFDAGAPFDSTGTYANPAFPDSVLPAPRTSGPDGRDEGALDITLPQ